ncbi:TIGR03747 family integrating conjugative element membrane protein [Solemya velum gill symbiont]|uniref:TIGR03747 family integrating conjugative element membrane protein n=1 Tax=Solemya velum gill symbiont TaxID=2340 RepID=UPI0009978505|nr:TIGR03747 family integrating conjugative element membrane protein [Solemya velum gill symbiont]OOZ45272.1 integrating conjugative element membrane protein [Solemya velum gill symbiont]OOZ50922.1 integrating conjugative element membrane protein [Solemya velum gill symbiont]OOZ53541.1 integrating conjugative element membrane protein [Solemya velum gill symbiont]OOZ58384.1 integrating conjugative element membrane protein [Solemya velum gill symbiont]OOZ68451.1 integrating conjugative element m
MAEAATDPRRTVVQQGLFTRGLATISQAILWLLFSLLFSIIVEWVGMVIWWPEQGLDHSRTMLAKEISYLDTDFRRSIVTSDPARFAKEVADGTYHYLFEVTRVVAFIHWVSPPSRQKEQGMRPTLHKIYWPLVEFVIAAMQVTQVFSVRLAILSLATPVFLLFSLVALVDGLVQRDLRRWGGGRESSFVYHYAKKAVLPLVVITWVTYLALPFSLHPTFIVIPFAALFAFAVAVTASTFKKYL